MEKLITIALSRDVVYIKRVHNDALCVFQHLYMGINNMIVFRCALKERKEVNAYFTISREFFTMLEPDVFSFPPTI